MGKWKKRPDGTWVEITGYDRAGQWYSGFVYPDTPMAHARQTTYITPEGCRELLLLRIEDARREGRGVR